MKKILIACLLSVSALTVKAQDEQGSLTVTMNDVASPGEDILANVVFVQPDNGNVVTFREHTWKVFPSDADGNILGDAVSSETIDGEPTGTYRLSGFNMQPDHHYMVALSAVSNSNQVFAAPFNPIFISNYTLTANSFSPCGQNITATGAFNPIGFTSLPPMGYTWKLFGSNASGTILMPNFPLVVDTNAFAIPSGLFTFPGSYGLVCNQYYIIQLKFYNMSNNSVLATLNKLVYIGDSYITPASLSFCCGGPITLSADYFQGSTNIPANSHKWTLTPCDAQGNPLGAPVYNSPTAILGTAISGGYTTGNNIINPVPALTCGSFYIAKIEFFNSSIPVTSTTRIITVGSPVQPVITGPSPVCGTGTYCVNNLGGLNTYSWNYNTYTPYFNPPPTTNSNCLQLYTPEDFYQVWVTATTPYGCTGSNTLTVTNDFKNPDFLISCTQYSVSSGAPAGTFKIGLQRLMSMGTAIDSFWVSENNPAGVNQYVYPGSLLTTYPYIYFHGYNGYGYSTSPVLINIAASNYAIQQGYFKNGNSYTITRKVYSANGCVSTMTHKVNMNGICTNCRTGQFDSDVNSDGSFSVFPNPTSGSFTVQLNAEAENTEVEIISLLGERIDAFTFIGTVYNYSPSNTIAPGIYMLRVTSDGVQTTKRMVIE